MKKVISCLVFVMMFAVCKPTTINLQWALKDVHVDEFHEGLAVCCDNGKYGVINTFGTKVIPCKYDRISNFSRGTAIFKNQNGESGVLRANGEVSLAPSNNYYISPVEPTMGFYKNKPTGFYIVQNKKTGKYALFDGYQFVTEFNYKSVFEYCYPFIVLTSDTGQKWCYNAISGEMIEGNGVLANGIYSIDKSVFFTPDGNLINIQERAVNKNGLEICQNSNGTCSIKDRNGFVLESSIFAQFPFWVDDIFYGVCRGDFKIWNSDGKEIFKCGSACTVNNGIVFAIGENRCYNMKGDEIVKLKGSDVIVIDEDVIKTNNGIFLVSKDRFIDDVKFCEVKENILAFKLNDGKGYFIEIKSGKQYGPFDGMPRFSEGIAVVRDHGNTQEFLISEHGKRYYLPNGVEFRSNKMSEGVISVLDRREFGNWICGVIYNPIGNQGFIYNQSLGTSEYTKKIMYTNGLKAFDNKKFADAKDIFYQIMMRWPEESYGIDNYAASLYNLGYYEESVEALNLSLEKFPNNAYAQDLLQKGLAQLDAQRNIQPQQSYSPSIWNTLLSISQAAGKAVSAIRGGISNHYIFDNSIHDDDVTMSSNFVDSGNFQSNYDNWARIAERHYNSLTNLGYSNKSKKSGSAGRGMSGSKYIQMKKSLREAQSEMRKIRRKAQKAGVSIIQSEWEDATVSY